MRRRGRGRRFGGGGFLVVLAVGGFLLFEGARSPERVGTAAPKGARDGQQAPSAEQTAEGAAGGGSDNLDLGVPVRVELADPRDGERLAVVTTNAAGRAQVERFRVELTIRNILEAPVGSTYAPTAGERERMESATKPELVVPIPPERTAAALQYWMCPLYVVVRRDGLVATGFFSVSRKFDTQDQTREYLAGPICNELERHFGQEPKVTRCGVAEYRFRYAGGMREVRFKCLCVGDGTRLIMTYHGLVRTDDTMEKEFAAVYASLKGEGR